MPKKGLGFILTVFLFFALTLQSFAQNVNFAEGIKVFKLNNGQTVVIKEVHNNPIVTVDTWVKTGSINESDQNNGVSHFLEHLFFKGTKKHPAGEVERLLESKGATYNAATSKDFTHYYTTISSNQVDTAIELQADMLLNPAVPLTELDKERKVVVEEIRRSKDDPGTTLFDNLNTSLFSGHPYRRTTLGPAEVIMNISREQIFDYYNKWYVPSNMVTIVVGDVETDKVLKLISKNFQTKNPVKPLKINYKKSPYIQKQTEKVARGNYNTGRVYLGYQGMPIDNRKDNMALDIASTILGDGRASRLYQNVKEKQNLVNTIGAGHYSLRDDSLFYITADFEPEKYDLVKAAVIKEVNRLKEQGITDEELKRAKTLLQRQFLYGSESVEDIANAIGYNMAIGKLEYYTNYVNEINKITKEDVKRSVNKYLLDSRLAISGLLPETTNVSANNTTENYKNVTKSKLNNGMTLITEKNNTNEIISLSVFVKGGKLVEPIPGISELIAGTMMKGTTSRDALELAKELENSGIMISPTADSDSFEIQLKSTAADFDKAFELLADIVNNPAFNKEDIEKVRKNMLEGIKESRDTPLSYAFEKFNRALYPDHPYGYVGEVLENNIGKISRDDIIKFYKETFIPQNMVVSVSGNVNPEKLSKKFNAYFPEINGKQVQIADLKSKVSPLDKNKLTFVKNNTSSAWMILGWPVSGIMNDKDYASLKVMNAILGNGLSSRLFVNMRVKHGLAYEISSVYPSRLDESFFVLYLGTEPKNVKMAKESFLKEIENIKTVPVSQKELNEAKQKYIGKFALSQETNTEKAHYLGWFETIGKGYKYNYELPELINSVTAEDIMNTANKYFNAPYITSIVAPAENVEVLEKEFK